MNEKERKGKTESENTNCKQRAEGDDAIYDPGVFGISSDGGEVNSRESFSVTGPQQIQ